MVKMLKYALGLLVSVTVATIAVIGVLGVVSIFFVVIVPHILKYWYIPASAALLLGLWQFYRNPRSSQLFLRDVLSSAWCFSKSVIAVVIVLGLFGLCAEFVGLIFNWSFDGVLALLSKAIGIDRGYVAGIVVLVIVVSSILKSIVEMRAQRRNSNSGGRTQE